MDFVNGTVVKQGSGSWTEEGNHSVDLGAYFLSDEFFMSSGPNGKDAADSEVVDNDGASIQGIEGDVVSVSFAVELLQFGSLLTGKSFNERVFLEMFFDDIIGMDVLLELGVSELVGGFEDDDG